MPCLRAVLLSLAFLLSVAAPAAAAPSHAETGAIIAQGLDRESPGAPFGRTEAAAVAGLNMGWGSIYVSWASLQPSGPGPFPQGVDAARRQYRDRFESLQAAGRRVNVTFIGTPEWASGNPNPNYPPRDPQAFGNFVAEFAKEFGDVVDGYELGNEPDGGEFWLPGPDPAKYAGFAKAGLAALAQYDPSAVKFIGATAGANDEFMESVLRTGVTGWDAVAFHSGTACKTEPPGAYIREDTGTADIHPNSTTGYRELVHMMRALGITAPVIADTGAGWSTTPALCDRGASKDRKPGGVSEADQSRFSRDFLGCAEQDPELRYVFFFSLYDLSSQGTWDHRMGLRRLDGSPKPAYGDLAATLGAPGAPAYSPGGFCGGYVDHTAPGVTLTTTAPVVDGRAYYAGALPLAAKGTDAHPIVDVDLFADGKEIPTTTKDGAVALDWQGAKQLSLGNHTITATARDEAGNTGRSAPLEVRRVRPEDLPAIATRLRAKVIKRGGRKVRVKGRLRWPKALGTPAGHVRIRFKRKRLVSKYSVPARQGRFRKTVTLRRRGKWRVRVFYRGVKPFSSSRAKTRRVRVR